MIALDTNVLVYAHRRESQHHRQAYELVKALAEGTSAWAIPWPCIYEFYSVVTHPRIWKTEASPPQIASAQIAAWISAPNLRLLTETQDFSDTLMKMIAHPRVRGPIIHDARIAALCLAHGVEELVTRDRDFQLFKQMNYPAASSGVSKQRQLMVRMQFLIAFSLILHVITYHFLITMFSHRTCKVSIAPKLTSP